MATRSLGGGTCPPVDLRSNPLPCTLFNSRTLPPHCMVTLPLNVKYALSALMMAAGIPATDHEAAVVVEGVAMARQEAPDVDAILAIAVHTGVRAPVNRMRVQKTAVRFPAEILRQRDYDI
eukprot:1526353-Prymnesium_polylepis.4